jgi:NTE family protein
MNTRNDPGLAVCLASSFCGYHAHAGFLNELDRCGWRPGRIAGSSAGALAGGLWAAGIRGEALESLFRSWKMKWAFIDALAIPRFILLPSVWGSSGVLSAKPLKRFLKRLIGDRRIEDLAGPSVELAVFNLAKRKGEIVREGPLAEFIAASLAVPMLFAAQEVAGEWFVDGGVTNETPFEQWLDDPAVHTILVHTIRHESPAERTSWSPGAVTASVHSVAAGEALRRRREMAEASGKRVHFLETRTPPPGLFQGKRAGALIDAGRATAAAWVGRE